MSATLLILLACLVALFIVLVTHAPGSDRVFTSASIEEIEEVRRHLEANGIAVYIKNMDMSRLIPSAHDLVNPTIHVVDPEERTRALALVGRWAAGKRLEGRTDGGMADESGQDE